MFILFAAVLLSGEVLFIHLPCIRRNIIGLIRKGLVGVGLFLGDQLFLICLKGNRFACGLSVKHEFFHALGQFFLKVDGIILPHVHGLYMDVVLSCRAVLRSRVPALLLLLRFRNAQSLLTHHVGFEFLLLRR